MAAAKSTRARARKPRSIPPKRRNDSLLVELAGVCATAEILESSFALGDPRFVVIHRHIVMPLRQVMRSLGSDTHIKARMRAIHSELERS